MEILEIKSDNKNIKELTKSLEKIKIVNDKKKLCKINNFIQNGFCENIYSKILQPNLEEMLKYPALKKVKLKIKKIIDSNLCSSISDEKHSKLIDELTKTFIPPGLKGVIWGNLFNKEIKLIIQNITKNKNLKCYFEKNLHEHKLSEIPDWYIIDNKTNKILVGFNQLDLWSGGHQTNRASKYVKNNDYHTKYKKYNIKIISVVCRKIEVKSVKNKTYKLFTIGIEKERLFYPKYLKNYIEKYFNS
jgi:hypothetical protein